MQHAFVYGAIAALSFIGFVSLIYTVLLFVYRPKGHSEYIIRIPENSGIGEIQRLIYGVHLKRLIFGDLIFDKIKIDFSDLSEEEKNCVKSIIDELGEPYNF